MSDTPETDAYIGDCPEDEMTEGEIAMCNFARRLERERDEAQRRYEAQCAGTMSRAGEIVNLRAERDALREENRKLREALNECREDSIELLGERDWWKDEPRGNHRQAYEQIQENIRRADELLKEQQ